MMTALPMRLRQGDAVMLDGTVYTWVSSNAVGAVVRPLDATQAMLTLTHEEMRDAYFTGSGDPSTSADPSSSRAGTDRQGCREAR